MTDNGQRKVRTGVVVSDKMDKTVIVRVQRQISHPKYSRTMRLSRRFVAHDGKEECHVGDTVTIVETRPLSRTKRWRVLKVVTKAQ